MAHENENNPSPFALQKKTAEGHEPSEQDLFNFFEKHLREVGILKEELTNNTERLTEYINSMLRKEAVRQQVTLLWKAHRLEDRKSREEEERREINLTIDKLVEHVRSKLDAIIKLSSELVINQELMAEIKEPTSEEIRNQIGSFISELNLNLAIEQVTRIDARDLTKRFLLKNAELKAKEGAKETQTVLNSLISKMPKVSPENDKVVVKPRLVEPLWKSAIPKQNRADALKEAIEESRGIIPIWFFEDSSSTQDILAGARGFLINKRLKALRELKLAQQNSGSEEQVLKLQEKSDRIQKVITLITGIFEKLFNLDPAKEENWCPNQIYKQNLKSFESSFASLLGNSPQSANSENYTETTTPETTTKHPDERKQILENTKTKLRSAGFKEIDIDQIARKITKHYNGDIRAAALARRETMSQNLSEDERQVLEGQYRMLAEAAGASLDELENEFNLRKEERRSREDALKAEKERKLAPLVAQRLSANQQRKQHFALRSKKDKKQRDSGVNRHRNKE